MKEKTESIIKIIDQLVDLLKEIKKINIDDASTKATKGSRTNKKDEELNRFIQNYEKVKSDISEEILERVAEPFKEVLQELLHQLRNELEEQRDEQEITENINNIDLKLRGKDMSDHDINRLLDERLRIKRKFKD